LTLNENIGKRDSKEKDGQHDGQLEELFFSAPFGSVDISSSAKGRSQARSTSLQKDGCDEQDRQDDLRNIEDGFEVHTMNLFFGILSEMGPWVNSMLYFFIIQAMDSDAHIHRARSIVATIITLAVLALLGMFVVRVLYYTNLIRSGELDLAAPSFTSAYSVSTALASQPLQDGIFDLATADDPSLGSRSAAITIVEFADFGCPYSEESSYVVRELALQYPDDVRFIYRDFPLTDIHPIAQKAAEAGECAQEQGKFWEYHDKLYQNQASLTEDRLPEFAAELNMNMFQFERCLDSGRSTDEVLQDYQAGVAAGVRGTPTFFVNGNRIPGAIPKDILDAIIQSLLNREP
jgi:protein-disulfide isomerase